MAPEHWPLFDLRITTPRVELRYPSDDDLFALAAILHEGIHDPSQMPFNQPWTRVEPPELERNALRHWWSLRAGMLPEQWHIGFGVFVDDDPVGVQGIGARDFAIRRTVGTGSWLVRRAQGQGIGKDMRAAVLHFAFEGLDAVEAHTGAFEDNPASLGVTRALGYEPNGTTIENREGSAARTLSFVMTRERWESTRRDDITMTGLDASLPFLVAATGTPAG
jgi:RimJ/RimL family protein N-acetyltransferase